MTGSLRLLRLGRDFRLLLLATLGSSIGTYLAAVALTLDIKERTESGTWIAALLVADLVPIVLVGLLLGPLVDRLPRKALMIASDLARLAVFAALPFVDSPGAIVALAAVSGVATGFFRPAVYAALPNLVRDDDLAEANGRLGAAENVGWMIGPVIGATLVAATGPDLAYWVNAATFLVSVVLVAGISGAKFRAEAPVSQGYWRDVVAGVSLVRRTPVLLVVLVVWNAAMIGTAFVHVAEVFLAKDDLSSGDLGFGLLATATGLGLTLGSLVAPSVLAAMGMRATYAGSLAVLGIGIGCASLAPTIWVALPLVALATMGNAGALVCNQLLVLRGAPDQMRGRALALLLSTFYLTQGVGLAVAGPVSDAVGGRAMFALAGCLFLATAALAFSLSTAMRRQALHRLEEPDETDALALFRDPPGDPGESPAFERLAALLEEIERTRAAEARRPV